MNIYDREIIKTYFNDVEFWLERYQRALAVKDDSRDSEISFALAGLDEAKDSLNAFLTIKIS